MCALRAGVSSSLMSPKSPGSPGPTLYHEPSLSVNIGDLGTGGDEAQEPVAAGVARQDGGWSRGYLDPLGMLGRVFGRKHSR